MKSLVLIPARGGSKGVPKKNIRHLHGKPLIFYTIEAAREIFDDVDICVSTDDEEIINVVKSSGINVPFKRPASLAGDQTGMDEVILHTLDHYEADGVYYDIVVLLQPTSPLRSASHIREALTMLSDYTDMVVSVKATASNPYYVFLEEDDGGYLVRMENKGIKTRQEAPKVFELNGAIYIFRTSEFRKTRSLGGISKKVKYVMGEMESVDIDTELDWQFVEYLMEDKS